MAVEWAAPRPEAGKRGALIGSGAYHNVYASDTEGVVRRELKFTERTRRDYDKEGDSALWRWIAPVVQGAAKKNPETQLWVVVARDLTAAGRGKAELIAAGQLIEDLAFDLGRVIHMLSRDDTAAVIGYIAAGGVKRKRVLLAAATLRMAYMFAHGRELLPTVCTQYSDAGVQLVTRCMQMKPGALATGVDGPLTIHPDTVEDLARDFFDRVKRSGAAVFDFKLANIGIEGGRPMKIRLIDVDADDNVKTHMSVHRTAFDFLQGKKKSARVPAWDKYQTVYTATLAIIEWLNPRDIVLPKVAALARAKLLAAMAERLSSKTVKDMAAYVVSAAGALATEMSIPPELMHPFTDQCASCGWQRDR